MHLLITAIVWAIFTTILTTVLVLRSQWKLNNPDWAEIAANKYVEGKRYKRDRRKKFDAWYRPERRKKFRSKA